ncbi:hypothetical protein [Paradesulfitobacterium ferrireducens]|uniref:hypothetical protein n=1 Tax=Paradesulfitobacterium ferrireducens TaxID=2816476 RepID=UPI001A907735|nr:hypothetical protein [Paradesulfitobacterium ferrireducens]
MIPLSPKGYRASRKFELKYGFDCKLLADGLALALNHEELAEFLHITPAQLDRFYLRCHKF